MGVTVGEKRIKATKNLFLLVAFSSSDDIVQETAESVPDDATSKYIQP